MAEVIWLASYPKSGNTWTRALLAGYFGEGAFDLNRLGAGVSLGDLRSLGDLLGLDPHALRPDELLELRPEAARLLARDVADREEPAIQKIHSANHPTWSGERVFPADAGRALYVVRNPLDVAASWAPFFGRTVDQAVEDLGDEAYVLNRPRRRFSSVLPELLLSWSGHVRSWIDAPGLDVHVLRYEDLQADTVGAFGSALRFLGVDPDPARVGVAVEAARFDRLQAKEAADGFREHPARTTAPFFRRGQSGGWRDELTAAQSRRVVADHYEIMRRLGYDDDVDGAEALLEGAGGAET